MDVKLLGRRAHAPDHFAGPKRLAQDCYPAVFRLADRAKCVARVSLLVGIQATLRKVAFESGIGGLRGASRAEAKCFALEALEKLPQLFDAG